MLHNLYFPILVTSVEVRDVTHSFNQSIALDRAPVSQANNQQRHPELHIDGQGYCSVGQESQQDLTCADTDFDDIIK